MRRQHLAQANSWRQRYIRFMHRFHARRAARTDVTTAFTSVPEPHTIGLVEKGQQLVAGEFLFSGLSVTDTQIAIWDITTDHPHIASEIQSFGWLDDLASLGDDHARAKAQAWVFDWIARYGDGRGAGWTPDITGQRVMRWINHGHFVLRGQDKTQSNQFFQSLGQQALFLANRWHGTIQGLPRFEALTGLIQAGTSLKDMSHLTGPAVTALAAECDACVDTNGEIITRNPEELLAIFSLLNWATASLKDADQFVPARITDATARIAPTLRALRHADGHLARFHGGGSGIDGRLDEALARSGVRATAGEGLHMGFARLTGGRTTLIADASTPPSDEASADAHASTLAFELTSGRRPVIVNCGSGARFGKQWRRASRATPSHSTMMIEGVSSSTLHTRANSTVELLTNLPATVQGESGTTETGRKLELSHNGYQPSHGVTHARILTLSVDGRTLEGEDILTTLNTADEAIFDQAVANFGPEGMPYAVRFHIHPDVEVALDNSGLGVALRLLSGEVWMLRHDGQAKLSLSGSVYLQNGRLKPRPTQQVVLSGNAMSYATRVRWSLAKAQDTPQATRDLVQADPMDPVD